MNRMCCIALLVLDLVSCHSEKGRENKRPHGTKGFDVEKTEVSTLNSLKGLEILLTPNTFKASDPHKTVRCRFQNDTEHEMALDTRFSVEKWNGNRWVLLSFVENHVFPDLLLGIASPKETLDIDYEYCLSKCLADGAKEKGRYRMVIEVAQSDDYRLEKAFKAFAEFTVE